MLLGTKSVHAALLSGERPFKRLLVDREHSGTRFTAIETLARSLGVPVEGASRDVLERLAKGGRKDQGVALYAGPRPIAKMAALERSSWRASDDCVAVARDGLESLSAGDVKGALEQWLKDDDTEENGEEGATAGQEEGGGGGETAAPVVVGAYRVHDPQNLGAICRSALYFGVERVVLSEAKGTLSRVTSAVSSASAGAAEFVPMSQAHSFVQFLRESRANGWTVVATGAAAGRRVAAEDLHRVAGPKIVVLGNEAEGLPREVADECDMSCVIPRMGGGNVHADNLDSLNVSVAAGIILHCATRRF